jgi:hypothetical protein
MVDLRPRLIGGDAGRPLAIALWNKVEIIRESVTPQQWEVAVDSDGPEGWSKKVLTLGARPKQWGEGEYGRLSMWVEWVFGVDRERQFAGVNQFVSLVVLKKRVSMDVKRVRSEEEQPVEYLVDDYVNLCSIYSMCLIVNQLPVKICANITRRLTN